MFYDSKGQINRFKIFIIVNNICVVCSRFIAQYTYTYEGSNIKEFNDWGS
jgi:hypothetical protein